MSTRDAPTRWHYAFVAVAVLTVAALSFWVAFAPFISKSNAFVIPTVKCDSQPDKSAALAPQELTKLLLVPERATLDQFRTAAQKPYCTLAPIEIRAGASIAREVYLLSFNPAVIVIVAFEDSQYLGFRLRPLREGAANISLSKDLQLYQNWTIKVGDQFNGVPVIAVLGQVTLRLGGKSAVAPFDGTASLSTSGCLRFDALDIPGYAFQFCGLENPRVGLVNQGSEIGSANFLSVGVLRRQKNGTYAFVEPAPAMLEKVVPRTSNK